MAGVWLLLLPLLPWPAAAQFSHQIATSAEASGPDGGASASPGDLILIRVDVQNLCDALDTMTVNSVGLVIHRTTGDQVIPNFLLEPVVLRYYGDWTEVSTTFLAQCDDPEVLTMDYSVVCTDNGDGVGFPGFARIRISQYGCQIRILHDSPALTMEPLNNGQARISWLASHDCFHLQSCAALGEPWEPVGGTVIQEDGVYSTTFDTTTTRAQFFRLAK